MSFEALAWGVKQKCDSPISKLCLLMICNYANEKGTAYPSQEHLAKLCQCSKRSIVRHIQNLANDNLITIQKEKNGAYGYNLYILNMGLVPNIHLASDRLAQNTQDKQIKSDFDLWWSKVPKKVAKGKARKMYDSLITKKVVDSKTLIFKMEEYANSIVNIEQKFIVHPTTWLSQQRWLDELEVKKPNNKNFIAG